DEVLSAFDGSGERWSLSLGRVDDQPGFLPSGVLWKHDGVSLDLFGLDLARGRVIWKRKVEGNGSCYPLARPIYRADAKDTFLIEGCDHVERVEAKGGRALWRKERRGETLIQGEESPGVEGFLPPRALGQEVEWLSPEGTPL